MPLTDDQLAEVRDWITDAVPPTDVDLDDIYDRLDVPTPAGVAQAILRKRLAAFLSGAASYTIEGVYQESSQANITGLNSLLNDLAKVVNDEEAVIGGGSSRIRVARLVRSGKVR
jgi:hypothetical protein